ncbi:MAG TPA: hypothetical protein EYP56_04175 [Planctomycetaceae bacterium]|nr:hypothetical protein [Planctomycetaceae bacterium]
MRIGVAKEQSPGERRVALVPGVVASLKQAGMEVVMEAGAGAAAGFSDEEFSQRGATEQGTKESMASPME